MKKTLLIINSLTGNGRNKTHAFDLLSKLSRDDTIISVLPVDADYHRELTDYLAADEYDSVVCVGGDGTLNRTVNEVMKLDKKPVIGYIPAGTTNDFSRNLGLVSDIDEACDIINENRTVSYDLGSFNSQYFTYVASFGPASSISYSTEQTYKNLFGYAAYIVNGLTQLPEILSAKCHMTIETEQETIEGDYLFGAICNSLSVAGFKLNNMSVNDLTDGTFELILIRCPQNLSEVSSIARSLLNSDFSDPYITFRRITKAKIITDGSVAWTLDGEYGGNPEEIEFMAVNHAVSIITGKSMLK